jgi:hypothetical protein
VLLGVKCLYYSLLITRAATQWMPNSWQKKLWNGPAFRVLIGWMRALTAMKRGIGGHCFDDD